MNIKLFDSATHTLEGPMEHNAGIYNYYNQSARQDIGKLREIMEKWFTVYPDTEKSDIKAQFRSNFNSSFFELFLHQLFTRLGFKLTPHPLIIGTDKKPDFLVEGNGTAFYLEAKEATDMSAQEQKEKNRLGSLYAVLDKMQSPNHFVRINKVQFKSDQQPNGRLVRRHFQQMLEKIDPDELETLLLKKGIEAIPVLKYEDDLICIEISPVPKASAARGLPGIRTIGIYSSDPEWMDNDMSIKTAIKNKASRYGILPLPYVIAINATGTIGIDDFEIRNALFGSLAIEYNINAPVKDERWVHGNDGIFKGPGGPQHTRVSGIFITNVNPGTYYDADYRLIMHPFAAKPFDAALTGLAYQFVSKGNLITEPGKKISEILTNDL